MDNKWCFSKHHPICKDEKGNINNFIDTTNWDISKYIPEKDKIEQKIKQDEEINITKVEEYSFSKSTFIFSFHLLCMRTIYTISYFFTICILMSQYIT